MNIYKKFLGIVVLLVTLGFALVFIAFVLFEVRDFEIEAAVVFIGISLIDYAFFHYIIITGIGFRHEPEEIKKRHGLVRRFIPYALLIIMTGLILGKAGYNYSKKKKREARWAAERIQAAPKTHDGRTRGEIMTDSSLHIEEKLSRLNLGQVVKFGVVNYSFERLDSPSQSNGLSLDDFYNKFQLSDKFLKANALKNVSTSNDTVSILLGNGRMKTISRKSGMVLLGFLENRNVYAAQEDGMYRSINGVSGKEFDGIPLFYGTDFCAGIQPTHGDDGTYLVLTFWYRDTDNNYDFVQEEHIPIDFYVGNNSEFKVKNIRWSENYGGDTFHFTLWTKKDKVEQSVQVKIELGTGA